MTLPDYSIGSPNRPGLAKLAEELGELQQAVGKLMAYPGGDHPDGGPPLEVRIVHEAADVIAAIDYVLETNPDLPDSLLEPRRAAKLERFRNWHAHERGQR